MPLRIPLTFLASSPLARNTPLVDLVLAMGADPPSNSIFQGVPGAGVFLWLEPAESTCPKCSGTGKVR